MCTKMQQMEERANHLGSFFRLADRPKPYDGVSLLSIARIRALRGWNQSRYLFVADSLKALGGPNSRYSHLPVPSTIVI